MNLKKLLLLFVIATGVAISYTFAQDNGESGYKEVIVEERFNFIADFKEDGKVYMSWTPISNFNESALKYYKVVRSSTNSNPKYPEDGYIKYSDDKTGFTSYIDEKPSSGTNYYRICAIMQDNNRYCSKVQQIEVNKNTTTTTTTSTNQTGNSNNQTSSYLSNNIKSKLDSWISTYIKKLNEKYGEDFSTINTKIQSTISKLEELKTKKTHLSKYINYIIEKLSETTGLEDVSNILNDI